MEGFLPFFFVEVVLCSLVFPCKRTLKHISHPPFRACCAETSLLLTTTLAPVPGLGRLSGRHCENPPLALHTKMQLHQEKRCVVSIVALAKHLKRSAVSADQRLPISVAKTISRARPRGATIFWVYKRFFWDTTFRESGAYFGTQNFFAAMPPNPNVNRFRHREC